MNRYQQIVELSDDCIKEIDLDGVVRAVNGKGLNLLRASTSSDVLDKSWVELWPVAAHDRVLGALECARNGESSTFEASCPVFDGELRDWWVRVSPLVENGAVVGILAVSSDVTARNRAMKAAEVLQLALADRAELLRKRDAFGSDSNAGTIRDLESRLLATNLAYQELEVMHHQAAEERKFALAAQQAAEMIAEQAQKGEAVGQLLAGVVHDLNNILQSAVAAVDLVLGSGELSEANARYLKVAEASLEQGGALSKRLIGFARRHPYEPEALSLSELVQSMTPLLLQAVGDKAEFVADITEQACCAMVDRNTIERALLNLVINARDACRPEDQIVVRTGTLRLQGLDPSDDRVEGDYVTLSVIDTGEGISEDVKERLFEVYFTTKPVGQGSGLGLAQVHSAVRQAGGFVTVTSALGEGACFELALPKLS
ncbi:ATP-binding protein [Stenotrophomonas maltophilia]|uniref:ATP-binding protein n=1 Tax=Stenotrophomonas maltophilia TaxID=40324 RepID=UPI001310139A